MSTVYKNFTLNDPGDPAPWGPIEQDVFKDISDTLVLDTVTGVAAPGTGHHHNKIYSTTSNVLALEVEETDEKVVVKNALKVVSLDTGGGTEGGVVITDDEGNIEKLEFVDDGALLTANGSVITKLSSGIEGSVLTVDSTEPTGLKWGNKPTGSAFSYPYRYRTELVAPPISGSFRLNNGTQPSSTEMYIHKDADPSGDIHDLLDNRSVGDTIVLVATDNLDAYLEFTITSKVDNTTYITYGITNIASGSSSLTGNEVVIVGFSTSRSSVLLQNVYDNSGSAPQIILEDAGDFPFSLRVNSSGATTDVHHVFRTYNKAGTVSGAIRGDGSISLGNTTDVTNGNLRYTGTDFQGRVGNVWESFIKDIPSTLLYPDDLENPDSADWAVNGTAVTADDTNNAGLRVRLFGSAEGVGFSMIIPSDAINMTIEVKSRPETAPGAARTVGLGFYERVITTGVGVWSTKVVLTDIDITTNDDWLIDTETKTVAAWGLTAGNEHQMQISRDTPTGGTDLTGDWTLRYIKLSFTK